MALPEKYQWLYTIGQLPKTVTAFLAIYGTKEVTGDGDNPVIINWAKQLGIKDLKKDSTPWCGLAMAWIVTQAGYPHNIENPLWAKNWKAFGTPVRIPMLGDVLTFTRESGGHVGLYIAEDKDCYHIGGGNQSDDVTITRILKSRLYSASMPKFRIGAPLSRKQYFVEANGEISKNEA